MTRTSFALSDEAAARELLEELDSAWEDLESEARNEEAMPGLTFDGSFPDDYKPTPFHVLYEA